MSNACIKRGAVIAVLAALISGCAGPRVMVEERRIPKMDRSKAVHVKNLAPARIASKAPGASTIPAGRRQAFCDNSRNLIHPVHFNTDTSTTEIGQCPLLSWEIRTGDPQITPGSQ